jgi:adenylylsulfate kinase
MDLLSDVQGKTPGERLAQLSPLQSSSSFVIWLTGLPSSGKTTIANTLKPKLHRLGVKAEILDGDVTRRELSPDLGFTKEDMYKHAKKIIYLCKILSANRIVSIVSAVSPDKDIRRFVRQQIGNNFIEVYVRCSLATCIKRDCKGLYKKALDGRMGNLIGLQASYDEPLDPDVIVDTEKENCDYITDKLILKLKELEKVIVVSKE